MEGLVKFTLNYIGVLLSVVAVGIVFWLFPPDYKVSIVWIISITLPFAILCVLLINKLALNYFGKKDTSLPKLRLIQGETCIFEPSDIFPAQSFVSLYHIDGIERFIGWGIIETVMSKTKNLQVVVLHFNPGYSNKTINLCKRNIILKPTVNFEIVQRMVIAYSPPQPNLRDSQND